MRYVAAYLLLSLGGNDSPSAKDIKKLLTSAGVGVDEEKLKFVLSQLEGKDINEVLAAGAEKLASVPSGGAVAASGAGGAAAGGASAPAAEEKKEESEEEESDDDMGFSLFD